MIHYFAKASARVSCGYCEEKILVVSDIEFDCDEIGLDEFGAQAVDVIGDQLDDDGWGYGGKYCPDCMETHAKQIEAQERADDYEVEDEQ